MIYLMFLGCVKIREYSIVINCVIIVFDVKNAHIMYKN